MGLHRKGSISRLSLVSIITNASFAFLLARAEPEPVLRRGYNLRCNAADTRCVVSYLARIERSEEPVYRPMVNG